MLLTHYDEKLHLKTVFKEGQESRQAEIDDLKALIANDKAIISDKDAIIANDKILIAQLQSEIKQLKDSK